MPTVAALSVPNYQLASAVKENDTETGCVSELGTLVANELTEYVSVTKQYHISLRNHKYSTNIKCEQICAYMPTGRLIDLNLN